MNTKTQTPEVKFDLAAVSLDDSYTDFILSRQAMQCTPATLKFYQFTAGRFLVWIKSQGITTPGEVAARHVRQYLAELRERGLKDASLNGHARAVKTLMIFWLEEKYTSERVKFEMPKIAKKRLPVLSAEEVSSLLQACNTRDKAIIALMVSSGLRRQEVCNLNWGDIDIASGLVRVVSGKGRKDRSSSLGSSARRAILAYKRTLVNSSQHAPLFQTQTGRRFTGGGMLQVFRRLEKKTGLKFSPHALRRSCAILSLRSGMSPLTLQAKLGHASLEMVQHYAQMTDDDLLASCQEHDPLDNLRALKR